MPPELGDHYLNTSYNRQGSRVFVAFKMGGKRDSASRGKGISIENEFSEEMDKNARFGPPSHVFHQHETLVNRELHQK